MLYFFLNVIEPFRNDVSKERFKYVFCRNSTTLTSLQTYSVKFQGD